MLFSDAVSNIFAGVFDVLNDVRQNVAVVLLFLYSIIPNLDAIIRVRVLLCEISILLFVTVCCYAKPRKGSFNSLNLRQILDMRLPVI